MLKIRQDQIDSIVSARWEDFYTRTRRHVRHVFTDRIQGLSEADLRALFDSSVARAHSFGLRTERQIVCVMDATILLGDRFENNPHYAWGEDILRSRRLIADDRARLLLAVARRVAGVPQLTDA